MEAKTDVMLPRSKAAGMLLAGLCLTLIAGAAIDSAYRYGTAAREDDALRSRLEAARVDLLCLASDADAAYRAQLGAWGALLRQEGAPAEADRAKALFLDRNAEVEKALDALGARAAAEGFSYDAVDAANLAYSRFTPNCLRALLHYDEGKVATYADVARRVAGLDRAPSEKIAGLSAWIEAETGKRGAALAAERSGRVHAAALRLAASAVAGGGVAFLLLSLARGRNRSARAEMPQRPFVAEAWRGTPVKRPLPRVPLRAWRKIARPASGLS